MGDEVYGWLSDKLLKITCGSGTAAINGINTELSKLAVDLNCQDVNLNFAGGWPTLKSPQVLIHIAKDSLSIESESVILGGIRCEDVGVSIPSFADANTRMHVKGALSQNLRTLIPALDETPFASITKTVNKLPWHTEGQLEGVLEIQLRLNNSEKIDVKFNGDLIGGALHGKSNLVPLVENISAIISFADDRLVVTQIQGDARWVQKEEKFAAFKFRGEGGLTINPGATSYEFGLSLVPDSLRISSRNLSKFIDDTIDDASIFFAGNDQELRISGVVNKSTYLDSRLQISDGQWGLACWTKKPLTVMLGQARFDTPWADGVIKIESPSDLKGVFAHLTLPDFGIWDDMESGSLSKTAVHSEVIDPRFLPGVSLSVGKLWLGLREIGQISIELAKVPSGLELKRFSIEQGPCSQFNATGTWQVTANGEARLGMNGRVFCRDVGRSLKKLRASTSVRGFTGGFDYQLSWMNPSSHNADELRINIDGMFSEGQVLYVKSGLLKAVELITLNV